MPTMHAAARAYAASGWPVFPIASGDKTPATRSGFKDATTNPETIDRWWSRDANFNVAVACGAAGLVVIDVDDRAALQVLKRADKYPPATLSSVTPSGGLHYFYLAPAWPVRNTAGRVPGFGRLNGVDIRGDGGYVVLPPSFTAVGNYDWVTGRKEPVPCPDWLRDPDPTPLAPVPQTNRHTIYGVKALEGILGELAVARDGGRNDTLNRCSYRVGQLVAGGVLDRDDALAQLELVAHRIGLDDTEVEKTIRSGYASGFDHPRGPR